MTRITGDDFMLIGLHKIASERGDGLIPEMMAVLRRSREDFDDRAGLVQFPQRLGTARPVSHAQACNENNVIAFPAGRGGRRTWSSRGA